MRKVILVENMFRRIDERERPRPARWSRPGRRVRKGEPSSPAFAIHSAFLGFGGNFLSIFCTAESTFLSRLRKSEMLSVGDARQSKPKSFGSTMSINRVPCKYSSVRVTQTGGAYQPYQPYPVPNGSMSSLNVCFTSCAVTKNVRRTSGVELTGRYPFFMSCLFVSFMTRCIAVE